MSDTFLHGCITTLSFLSFLSPFVALHPLKSKQKKHKSISHLSHSFRHGRLPPPLPERPRPPPTAAAAVLRLLPALQRLLPPLLLLLLPHRQRLLLLQGHRRLCGQRRPADRDLHHGAAPPLPLRRASRSRRRPGGGTATWEVAERGVAVEEAEAVACGASATRR